MRLLANGLSTAVTTLAGSTAVLPGGTTASVYGAQQTVVVEKIVVMCGGTTIAPASSGGLVNFRYGDSSGSGNTTLVICPQPNFVGGTPAPFQFELDGLGIQCRWFEAVTMTTCAGGVGVYVFGKE